MDGSVKVLVIGGALFIGVLVGVGLMLNAGEDERVQAAKDASDRRMAMFNMAMDQAKQAQDQQRMHMEMMERDMMFEETGAMSEGYADSGYGN